MEQSIDLNSGNGVLNCTICKVNIEHEGASSEL